LDFAVSLAVFDLGGDFGQVATLSLVFGRHLAVAAAQRTAAIAANVSPGEKAVAGEANVLRQGAGR
jgi:hypothetical protein